MITGIYEFGFFCPKMAVSWRIPFFPPKKIGWNPYFYSVFGVRIFWAKLSKKGNFWTPTQKRRKFWLTTEKLFFCFFFVFFNFSFLFFWFFCLFFFVSFFVFCFLFCCFLEGLRVRWGGPKKQKKKQKKTNKKTKKSLFVICFFVVPFLSLLLIDKKPFFPPKKGIFCLFLVFLFLSPFAFFGLPLFQFLFLCLSVVLFLLPSFFSFFLLSFCFLFLSLAFLFFLLCFGFRKRTTSKYSIAMFFPEIFLFLLVSCLVICLKSLFLIFAFSRFSVMFFVQHQCFSFKKQNWKAQIFGQKGGCNKTGFLWTCVLQNVKSYRFFFAPFLPKFWLVFKNTIKIAISANF